MQLTKKKTALLAMILVAVFAIGVYAGVQLAPKYVYVTVEEAISIEPDFIEVTLYVGESGSANFTIHNLASVDIPLTVSANVTEWPELGNPEDLTLTYPETLTALPGDNTLTIEFALATGAWEGDYTITINVTRI
jgi:hypothetical protein